MLFFSLPTLLMHVLAASAASIPFVAAQITTDELNEKISSTAAPAPGFNVDGGSVFDNFVNAVNNMQFFFLTTGSWVYEKPGSEPRNFIFLDWCSDLTFPDFSNSSLMGYAGRCVATRLGAGYADSPGVQSTYVYSEGFFYSTGGISAVFVEQLNIFEGQYHSNTDGWSNRYWDSGLKTAPYIAWEGHDEGDMAPKAATRAHSGFGEYTWMSAEVVAQLFNTSIDEFTPEKFKQVYENAWIKEHEEEAASDNPNPEAELAIIEQVKNETDSAYGGSDADTKEDGGSGRKLTSVAARFVSAALRVFGI